MLDRISKTAVAAWVFLMVWGPGLLVSAQQSVPVAEPGSNVNPVEQVSILLQAMKSGQWPVFAGALIMLLLYAANKAGLKEKIGSNLVPWVAVGLGVLSSVGVALASGIDWKEALIGGLVAGLSSVGLWEAISRLFKKKEA